RASTTAPLSPAAPPPTTTTSYVSSTMRPSSARRQCPRCDVTADPGKYVTLLVRQTTKLRPWRPWTPPARPAPATRHHAGPARRAYRHLGQYPVPSGVRRPQTDPGDRVNRAAIGYLGRSAK